MNTTGGSGLPLCRELVRAYKDLSLRAQAHGSDDFSDDAIYDFPLRHGLEAHHPRRHGLMPQAVVENFLFGITRMLRDTVDCAFLARSADVEPQLNL